MKINRNRTLRLGLRMRARKTLVAVIAILMTLALCATALADNGRGGGKPEGQGTGTQTQPGSGTDHGTSTAPGQKDKRNAQAEGLNVEKIEEAIAALTDEDARASLTTLLSAYVDAWTAKQEAIEAKNTDEIAALTDAMTAAKTALDTALESAGISTDTLYGVPEEAKDGTGKTNNRPALDLDKIGAAIATLADTD